MGRRPLIAGNWKMFGRVADLDEIKALGREVASTVDLDVAICPPATLIALAVQRFGHDPVQIGGQDCHPGVDGAQTGDINAAMLADAGARYCIVGHSERRRDHGEDDALVRDKARAVAGVGLAPIICVGESLEQRKSGRAVDIVMAQLAASVPDDGGPGTVVAYEPVWAIGTGLTPGLTEIAEMHTAVRNQLEQRFGTRGQAMRVLYGGSVKPANAGDIFGVPGVDGALVGGASLKAAEFSAIIRAHPAAAGR